MTGREKDYTAEYIAHRSKLSLSPGHADIEAAVFLRNSLGSSFFLANAPQMAALCEKMAARFASGGRLIAVGESPAACSDVHHVTVEFVHPVIVGKRALPAFGVTGTATAISAQLGMLAERNDIVLSLDHGQPHEASSTGSTMEIARSKGCLTIAFGCDDADYNFVAESQDVFVLQEIGEVTYHMLWELVHVFFDHNVTVAVGKPSSGRSQSAASFLYPFLDHRISDAKSLVADVERSIIAKSEEINSLRSSTIGDQVSANRTALHGALEAIKRAFNGEGTLYAIGNGGSATDAMDTVADYLFPPHPLEPRRAQDLANDSAVITALSNDIGPDVIFSRQIIAHAREHDIIVAYSTSGNSRNIILALSEARSRGLASVAFVGYDGGRILSERLADHVIASSSQNIPRIQEAQATAHHILRTMVG